MLQQRARFHPSGVAGRAYWWLLLVPHAVIWRKLLAGLLRAAQEQPARARPAGRTSG